MVNIGEFEKKFFRVARRLETLNKTFVIKGKPSGYKHIWTPKNEIRLWSVPRQTAEILNLLVLIKKPKIILELGTSAGYSTIWLALAARDIGGKVYTAEISKLKTAMAKEHFKEAGLCDYIEVIEGDIADVLKKWRKKTDFVFLDADKHNYLRYLKQLESNLAKGAVLVADNAINFRNLMEDYLRYVSKSPKYHSYLLRIDNGLMISIKK